MLKALMNASNVLAVRLESERIRRLGVGAARLRQLLRQSQLLRQKRFELTQQRGLTIVAAGEHLEEAVGDVLGGGSSKRGGLVPPRGPPTAGAAAGAAAGAEELGGERAPCAAAAEAAKRRASSERLRV